MKEIYSATAQITEPRVVAVVVCGAKSLRAYGRLWTYIQKLIGRPLTFLHLVSNLVNSQKHRPTIARNHTLVPHRSDYLASLHADIRQRWQGVERSASPIQ